MPCSLSTLPLKTRANADAWRVSEFQSKPNLAAGQKGHLEQARLGFVVIDPASHLSHDDAQIGAATANLDNVHATPPLSAEERSGRETGRYVAFERGLRKRPIHPATIRRPGRHICLRPG